MKLVFGILILGATVVLIGSVVASELLVLGLDLPTDTAINIAWASLVITVIVAPFVEETIKWGTARFTLRSTGHLDEAVDAMVYGTAIGLGFAGIENVLYLLQGAQLVAMEPPLACVGITVNDCAISQVLPARAFGTALMHGLAGGFGGHAIAKARLGSDVAHPRLLGLSAAIGVHAVWNLSVRFSVVAGLVVLAAAAWWYSRVFKAHLANSPHAIARVQSASKPSDAG